MQTITDVETGPGTTDGDGATRQRLAARRARFRESVQKLADRAQSTELVRMLLLPGAFALVGGFGFMFLGWWGASRTHRQVEQLPYLISGGLIGLGLVFVGGLILASAMWMTMLARYQQQAGEQSRAHLDAIEERLRAELRAGSTPGRAFRAGGAPPDDAAPRDNGATTRPLRAQGRPQSGAANGSRPADR